ncbi:MAG: shikimate kinase [Hyphomicrobiales bacterium]
MVSHLPFSDQILGVHVGRRVKSLRRKLNLTRRELAERSSISERYIGQLENGQANASLNVLNRIVTELGTSIACVLPRNKDRIHHEPLNRLLSSLDDEQLEQVFRLVSNKFETQQHPSKGIALVGMRGAGKTSLGSKLSELSGIPFVRLTKLIADQTKMTIGELIELRGINGFRRLEHEALQKIASQPEKIILETSGGFVGNLASYAFLQEHFTTIWIKASPEEHMQRVIDQNDLRPMAGRSSAMSDLKALYAEREPGYRQADYVLDTSTRAERDCLGELTELACPILYRQSHRRVAAE